LREYWNRNLFQEEFQMFLIVAAASRPTKRKSLRTSDFKPYRLQLIEEKFADSA